MKMSEQINELAEAMALAQGEIQNPAKNADNPFFKSKYADLAEVLNVVRPSLSKNGLNVIQMPYRGDDGSIGMETLISHKSGQWIQGSFELPLQVAKNVAQDAGSLLSYMRRYTLSAAIGVAQEDQDANLGDSKEANTGTVTNLKTITPEQVSEIVDLLDATGTDKAGFLQWVKADSVEQIAASKFTKARDELASRLEKSNAAS